MKVLLVDDHALIRDALRGVLRELVPNATILEAGESAHALVLTGEHPDIALALLDINLPDRNGLATLTELRRRHPAAGVVILSAFHDRANVMKALDLGAVGFIPKSSPREILTNALRLILSGGVYVPPEALLPISREKSGSSASERSASRVELDLTERQLEVLALMMQGKSNKVICRQLDLAENTVKNHVTAILKALKATNRTEAVIAAGALRLDPPRRSD